MTDKFSNINFIEHFQHGIVIFDDALQLVAYNQKALVLVGLTAENAKIGTPLMDYVRYFVSMSENPDKKELIQMHAEHLENRENYTIEQTMPDGSVLYRHCEFMEDGGLVMTITDVTDLSDAQKKLEGANVALEDINKNQEQEIQEVRQELETRNRILEVIVNNLNDGVSLISNERKLLLANKKFADLLELPEYLIQPGIDAEEIYAYKALQGDFGDFPTQDLVAEIREFAFRPEGSEREREFASGRIIKTTRKPVESGLVTTVTDITTLKQAQREIEKANKALAEALETQSEELSQQRQLADRLLAAMNSVELRILLFDKDEKLIFANDQYALKNPGAAELLIPGIAYEDFLRSAVYAGLYPEVVGNEEEFIRFRIQSREENTHTALTLKTLDGEWLQVTEQRLPDGSTIGFATDITVLKEAELELERSEERFRDFAEDGADWFWEMDESLKFTFVMGKVEETLGIIPESMIGKTRNEVHAFDDLTEQGDWNGYLDNVDDEISFKSPTLTAMRPDGSLRYITTTGKPFYDTNGEFKGYRGVGRDITDLTRAEEALRRSQKMEAVGQLSGGIAHDFNNLLGIIFGNLELLGEKITDRPDLVPFVDNALKSAGRAAELTRKLLGFSRHQSGDISTVSLNEVVTNLNTLIERSLTASITVDLDLTDKIWDVSINVGDFEDALLNLALNAKDAMPTGGQLRIETQNEIVTDERDRQLIDLVPGEYVVLTVTDTGTGMSKEVREHVFEPFYTTKEMGKGTGLGLSMVFGFVKRSCGFINLTSEVGHGSTFSIYLPVSTGTGQTGSVLNNDALVPLGQGESIILVDDEVDLLDVTLTILTSLGYKVLAAESPEAALAILASHEKIDLLFSDVILPGDVDGMELVVEARKVQPGLKSLLTSGFTADVKARDDGSQNLAVAMDGHYRFLQKPYTRSELAVAIREALDFEF